MLLAMNKQIFYLLDEHNLQKSNFTIIDTEYYFKYVMPIIRIIIYYLFQQI